MTTTPDYNYGKIHAWSGGECPVHPDSVVEVTIHGHGTILRVAGSLRWSQPLLFRVTKPYVEPPKPFELWVNVYADGLYGNLRATEEDAVAARSENARTVHMREVTE